jgi:hypothetical protein
MPPALALPVSSRQPETVADLSATQADFDLPDEDAPAKPLLRTNPAGFVALLAIAGALWCTTSLSLCVYVLPLALAGACLGLTGLLIGTGAARRWISAAAAAVGGILLVTALLSPAMLGPAYRLSRQGTPMDTTTIRAVPLESGIISENPDWADASRAALQQGRLRLQIVSAALTQEKEKSASKKKPSDILVVRVRAQRTESPGDLGKRQEKSTAGPGKAAPRLTDAAGNVYAPHEFENRPSPPARKSDKRKSGLFPVSVQEEVFAFDAPPVGAEPLRLEIPSEAWGGQGVFRFTLPGSMFRHERVGPAGGK